MLVKLDARELKDVLDVMDEMDSSLVYLHFLDRDYAHVFGTSGDVEVFAKVTCSTEGYELGRLIALNKRRLTDIVKDFVGDSSFVVFDVEGDNANVRIGNDVLMLKVEKPAENESFIIPADIEMYQFSVEAFARALDHVIYASSYSDAVYIANGQVFYGCDGYRLAKYEERVFPDAVSDMLSIPVSSAKLLVKAAGIYGKIGSVGVLDGVLVVGVDKIKIGVKCGGWHDFELVSAGSLKGCERIVNVDTKVFISALMQVKDVVKSKYVEVEVLSDGIRLNARYDTGALNGVGKVCSRVNVFKDMFDVQSLIHALEPIKDAMVELRCYSDDELGSCISMRANGGKYEAVVMGVNLD